ncbi:MAG: phosphatidate cytidylyltransferase [Flavobacteriales bacterium]|jgi:phosphatidate cytidylyltransferase|nr:phosphatidate cytidylyltransferase [Flavobacteriales bacterium]MBT5090569.1 phosphatidate cytidylyltransferase [Flavobacteriales bacterium]MBT5750445.1 phosphatidate cytidylyltransferase [Flavobacteriales bacterium]
MNEILKRALSGLFYMLIMWFGTSFSELSFHILFIVLGIASIYEMWKLRKGKPKAFAFLYLLIPFILIHFFGMIKSDNSNSVFDPSLALLMFILTWTFDTFAYLFGIQFGKTKIMPSVSPKKSWEGFAGGFVFTAIASFITTRYYLEIDNSIALGMSLLLPFTATLGDFTESYFKRKAGVKDSGKFIPGHGGILDRMDAFMVTIPVLYIYLNII